jgi:nicotinamidase-related amidase
MSEIMSENKRNNGKTALLVIDVQASFPQRPYWSSNDAEIYLQAQNRLISQFQACGQPVIRVFHVESEGPFSFDSGFVRPLDGLIDFEADLTIHKQAHSAFAGTSLANWLTAQQINHIVVSGIRSEQCCETSTRDASDRGFQVDYVTEATLTFPMQHTNGRHFSATDIKERCELVLSGRFARIATVDQIVATLAPDLANTQ